MNSVDIIASFFLFVFLVGLAKVLRPKVYWWAVAGLGLAFTSYCFYQTQGLQLASIGVLLTFVLLEYWLLKLSRATNIAVIAMAICVGVLVFAKLNSQFMVLGLSYTTFRIIYTAYEITNERIVPPGFSQYLAFVFFPLTLQVGPINPFSRFKESLESSEALFYFNTNIAVRLCLGGVKIFFLSTVVNTSLIELFGDSMAGARHAFEFLLFTSLKYLNVYLLFSGYCDLILALAAIVGISIKENFNSPLGATNIQDFWQRWHLTLTDLIRELVFTPLSLWFKRTTKLSARKYVPIVFVIVFLIIGLWHGIGINFVYLGLMHAAGMITHYYFSDFMNDRWPERKQVPLWRALSWLLTFSFVSLSFAFFSQST